MLVGISGTGRIGRLLLRKVFSDNSHSFRVNAINSVCSINTLAHLLKYDSVHGKWDADIRVDGERLVINGQVITILSERSPEQIPWRNLGIELVVDATGQFNNRQGAGKHLLAGASRVLVTAPGSEMDMTVVMGVNEKLLDLNRHMLLSAASCTTNCLAPVLKILDDHFQVESGWMTAVHAYTNDQNHLDNPHSDLRRARACTQSIIPTSTGVGKALIDVLPGLAERIHGISLRVPTQDVSLLDLTVQLSKPVSRAEVRNTFLTAINGGSAPYVAFSDEPLVSVDYIGNEMSAIIDGISLMAAENQVKLLVWYDNEWGYASRVIDLMNYIALQTHQKELSSTWETAAVPMNRI